MSRRRSYALIALLWAICVSAACGSCWRGATPEPAPAADPVVEPTPSDDGLCRIYASDLIEVGATPTEIPELSGLVASRRHPDLFWAHNDSGHAVELFAIRKSGEVVARFPLEVKAHDLEDLALGPCSAGTEETCVYLADVGDNYQVRSEVRILKVPEPDPSAPGSLRPEVLAFRYPDGKHNAESLIADPISGALYVITKAPGTLGQVYRLDGLAEGVMAAAVLVGTLRPRRGDDHVSTAADLHPTGRRLLLRTYSQVWEFRAPDAGTVEALVNAPGIEVPTAPQQQGEAIAYTADGVGYVMASEGAGGVMFEVRCRP